MLIINADDWGRSPAETDAALVCHRAGRITSVSAMAFMVDSERSAEIAKESGVDTGLHLNLSESLSAPNVPAKLREHHGRVSRFLKASKYALLVYNPMLRDSFRYVYTAQAEEYVRLYGREPSHVDGHQHMHLCTNMLAANLIPRGQRVRRSFSFRPGQKSTFNRAYRSLVDRRLSGRYRLTDYFFCLSQSLAGNQLPLVGELARSANVELMTHPAREHEFRHLMSDGYRENISAVPTGSYALL